MKTFFALTVIPKEQQKGSKNSHRKSTDVEKVDQSQPKMLKPLYETASAVTTAIAAGSKQTDPNYPTECPYKLAERWQKELKRLEGMKFRLMHKAKASRNGLYNHTMQFGR